MKLNENQQAWVDLLRSGIGQCQSRLGKVHRRGGEITKSYCCLGAGSTLVPSLKVRRGDETHIAPDLSMWALLFVDENGVEQQSMAPTAFVEWLGLNPQSKNAEASWDVWADVPVGIKDKMGYQLGLSGANMNDAGWSFDMIADVFQYFGMKECPQ